MKFLIRILFCLLMVQSAAWCVIPINAERHLCIRLNKNFRGEKEFAKRFLIACQNLNWTADLCTQLPTEPQTYDWILTVSSFPPVGSQTKEYLSLFDPVHHYFGRDGLLKDTFCTFDGYLTTYEPDDNLLKTLDSNKKRLFPKRWYPTVQYRPFVTVDPEHLFFVLGHWGDRFNQKNYKKLYELLDRKSYTRFYGPSLEQNRRYRKYFGEISYDGESILNHITENGVCLIIHSDVHHAHGIPSGRIFEAAAASAVIICDLNPFVVEQFGDSVLYFNHKASGEVMFKQIDGHMQWIQTHRDQALEMAQRAHAIFEERFLLEMQLLELDRFNQNEF